MPRKSISDEEIALIKAMLSRGLKNKDIQFHFNRPDRAVNSGRITDIRQGRYANSAEVAPASDEVLAEYLRPPPISSVIEIIITGASTESGHPASAEKIRNLFVKGLDSNWRLTATESDNVECKSNFGFKHADKWLKAIAGLSNNSGGFVLFGVHDQGEKGADQEDLSYLVAGMNSDAFTRADPSAFSKIVKSVFDPTPKFHIASATMDNMTVGILYVSRHEGRPVIATKQEGSIQEGDIFYRYPGQSSRIKYSDLRAMLDSRDADARMKILPLVERLLRIGPTNTFLADLTEGTLADGERTIQIDPALIQTLTFIKEGEFSDKAGAPTLKIVGELRTTSGATGTKVRLGLLTRDDLLRAFLTQDKPDDPLAYIKFAVEVGKGERLPLHYFGHLAGMAKRDLLEFINNTSGTVLSKRKYVRWLDFDAAFAKPSGKPKMILQRLLDGELPSAGTPIEAARIAQAITGLPRNRDFDKDAILLLLKKCFDISKETPSVSFVRRAICRLDEITYPFEDELSG